MTIQDKIKMAREANAKLSKGKIATPMTKQPPAMRIVHTPGNMPMPRGMLDINGKIKKEAMMPSRKV